MIVVRWCTVGDDKVPVHFRLAVKANPKVEVRELDELGEFSWQHASLPDANKTIIFVLSMALEVGRQPGVNGLIDLGRLEFK